LQALEELAFEVVWHLTLMCLTAGAGPSPRLMTSVHERPIAFNMAEAICAAVARSPSCAEPNIPAMRASLWMSSAIADLPCEGDNNTA
jgi:hypothetical protein